MIHVDKVGKTRKLKITRCVRCEAEQDFSEVFFRLCMCAQLLQTLYDPMDGSPPGSSVHGVSPARLLEWVAFSSSRGSSQARDQT